MAATRERVVGALLDTFFPKLQPADRYVAEDQKHQLHVEYSSFQPTDVSGTVSKVMEAIDRNLNEDQRNQLYLVFFLLSTRWGTALLGGFHSCNPIFPTAFPDLPVASRDQILQSWSTSRFYLLRKAFTGLKSLLLSHTFTYMNSEASGTAVLRALQYPITDPKRPARPLPAAVEAERVIESSLIDLSACCDDRHKLAGTLGAKGLRVVSVNCDETVVKGCNIDPDIIEICQPECVVSCDAVVVGSGAGGGVVSARLAASGMRVIIVEKSTFVPSASMSQQEGRGVAEMYEASGLLLSESGATSILAGSTLGGGTRVNWSASFRTPDHVRREWSQKYELECFSTENEDFEQALDAVCNRLSVKTGFTHGGACKAFASGLESLNIHCGQVPRNCVELSECSGYCSFGCARGAKQDTVNTFLADAAKHGARIITGAFVESIIRLKSSSRPEDTDKRRVGGVLILAGDATARPTRVVISSPVVVSCGGAINSPALFLRSGISCSGMIGSNLRLHPCTCVVGKFPLKASSLPDGINGTIRCWEGPLMSIFSKEAAEWESSGYGCILYTPASHPGLFAAACPWINGADFRNLALEYPNTVPILVLVRDTVGGKVVIDKNGMPRIHYTLGKRDRQTMVKGMVLGLQTLAAAGASAVMTLSKGINSRFYTGSSFRESALPINIDDPKFQAYLKNISRVGVQDLQMPTFSAHQMGTVRMGKDSSCSAVNSQGECWSVPGLYCADGSVFPTSLGVNPMVTIESIAYMIGGQIVNEFYKDKSKGAKSARNGKIMNALPTEE